MGRVRSHITVSLSGELLHPSHSPGLSWVESGPISQDLLKENSTKILTGSLKFFLYRLSTGCFLGVLDEIFFLDVNKSYVIVKNKTC